MTDFSTLLAQARSLAASHKRLQEQEQEAGARAQAGMQRLLARFEWRPVAAVALLEQTYCTGCGSQHEKFLGFGTLMHRQADQTTRILMAHGRDQGLPLQRHYTSTKTEACVSCFTKEFLDGTA